MAVGAANGRVVAHVSLDRAFMLNRRGEVSHIVKSPAGSIVTNVAFRPGTCTAYFTESESGHELEASAPPPAA